MEPSIAGVLICCGLFAVAWWLSEVPVIVALMASLPFGSTAIVTLSALGGSSPLIYVVFLMGLFAIVALRRQVLHDLGTVFAQQPVAWLVLLLALYTMVGAVVLPRMFAGETTAFIPIRSNEAGRIAEVLLGPVAGNITQSMYFVVTALTFFAFSVLLRRREAIEAVRIGFFVWISVHAGLGFIDLFGKIAGLGDVLAPIRSASYAMLTEVEVAGFWRIAGGYSEASAFGGMTVSLLAFAFTYWRGTQSRFALVLAVALIVLLILSTSSTAYVAGAILLMYVLASLTGAAFRDRLRKEDVMLLVASSVVLVFIVGAVLHNERILDPFWRLIDTMVINKASSTSGAERADWNYRSLQSVVDTVGLGIGIGSSRASSWIIAVISQLGVVGTFMMGYLTLEIIRGVGSCGWSARERKYVVIANSARAACLAGLVTASISSGYADPGLRFYIALAVILSCRLLVRQNLDRPMGSSRFAMPAAT